MASRYWVGGGSSTNWNATGNTNWSATDGGANNASVPVSTDDVFFTGNSGVGTAVLNVSSSVKSIDCTGYAGTLSHAASVNLTIAGSGGVTAKWVSGMTYTLGNANSSQVIFTGTSGTTLFTTGTKTFGTISLQGVGGTVQLQDNLVAAALLDLEAGTWDFNNKNATLHGSSGQTGFSTFSSAAKTVKLGTGTITTDSWSNTASNTTVTVGASGLIIVTGNSSGSNPWNPGTNVHTYYDVTIDGPADGTFPHIIGSSTFHDLTLLQLAGAAGGLSGTFLLDAGATQTVNGTFTIAGLANKRLFVLSGTPGSTSAINAVAVSLSNVCFIDIVAGGAAAPWTGTLLGDGQNNSGITFTAAAPQYWYQDTGNWSDPTKWFLGSGGTGGAGRVPLPQDHAIFDANSFSANGKTVTQDLKGQVCRNLDFSAITKTTTLSCAATAGVNALGVFGSVSLSANLTISATSASATLEILDRTGPSHTSAGVSIPVCWRVVLPGASVTLQDALTVTSASGILLDSGTINTNGKAVSTPLVSSNNSNTRSIALGASVLTVTGAGTCWNFTTSTGASISGTGTIKFTDATASTKTLAFGGLNYGTVNVWITGAGTGAWTISGSNTFADFKIDTGPKTINFTIATTQTVTRFIVDGSSGNLITLQSTAGGTAWNLSCAAGLVCVTFVSLKDSHASGGATFRYDQNSTSVSGNTGWAATTVNAVVGASTGTATVAGVSGKALSTVGSATASATVAGTATKTSKTAGTSAASSTAAGGGARRAAFVGSSTGTAAVAGGGARRAAFAATAAGIATVTGFAQKIRAFIGSSAGVVAVAGVARSFAASLGTAIGIGTATGAARSRASAAGAATGTSMVVGDASRTTTPISLTLAQETYSTAGPHSEGLASATATSDAFVAATFAHEALQTSHR